MSNIFDTHYPEFITEDSRTNVKARLPRPDGVPTGSYVISSSLQSKRFGYYFDDIDLTGKTILDVGSATGALGAWALHHGAKHYRGIEINPDLVEISNRLLGKYFDQSKFTIVKSPFEDAVLEGCSDITIMSGVLSATLDYFRILKKFSDITDDLLIVEADWPIHTKFWPIVTAATNEDDLFNLLTCEDGPSVIFLIPNRQVWSGTIEAKHPLVNFSYNALKIMSTGLGWTVNDIDYKEAWAKVPELYNVFAWGQDQTNELVFSSRSIVKCRNKAQFAIAGFKDAIIAQSTANQ